MIREQKTCHACGQALTDEAKDRIRRQDEAEALFRAQENLTGEYETLMGHGPSELSRYQRRHPEGDLDVTFRNGRWVDTVSGEVWGS